MKNILKIMHFFIFLNGKPAAIVPGDANKRPEHLHALFSRVVELNKHKSMYVMIKLEYV